MPQIFSRLFVSALILGSFAAVSGAQEPPKTPKENFIVNGVPAQEGELPWQVALIRASSPETDRWQFCGGSLIAEQWVLTAAHCVDNAIVMNNATRLDIVAGTLTYATGGERVKAEKIIVHDKWNSGSFDFDAALIKLASPVKMGGVIALADESTSVPDGFDIRVSGWGATAEGAAGSAKLLRVDVPVVSKETCNKPEAYNGDITDSMLCAGKDAGGFDSCQGDSGGPAVAKLTENFTLVGVVSWGIGCARPLKYGVYTRVSVISKWATDVMAAN
jgi:trypsin